MILTEFNKNIKPCSLQGDVRADTCHIRQCSGKIPYHSYAMSCITTVLWQFNIIEKCKMGKIAVRKTVWKVLIRKSRFKNS